MNETQRDDRRRPAIELAISVGAACFGVADLLADFGSNGAQFSWPAAALVIGGSMALLARRHHPLAVLALACASRLAVAAIADTEIPLSIPVAIALYSVVRGSKRPEAAIATVLSAIAAIASIGLVSPDAFVEELLSEIVVVLLVYVSAELVTTVRGRTEERIAARTAERVHAERLRIARDLHDVVAHGLSSIAVQSGIAARLIDDDPEHAKQALTIINQTGRDSLDELRSFLGVLRSEDDTVRTHPTPNQPNDIEALVAQAKEAGVGIELTTIGSFPPEVPNSVVLATYRIVQESLTNVARHAGAVETEVVLNHNPHGVEISVTNAPSRTQQLAVPSTGVGILGMNERAEAVGGRLTTATLPDGGFEVRADLPYDRKGPAQ